MKLLNGILFFIFVNTVFAIDKPDLSDYQNQMLSHKYSGKYEQISIAVDKNGRVTGFYKEQLGDNFSCYFGFSGDLKDGKATISVDEEGYEGRLHFEGDNLVLAIPQAQDLPGCGMVLIPEIAEGVIYGIKKATNWIEIKIVPADGVALRKEPNSDSDILELLKKWHVLGVLEHKNNWSKVSFYKVYLVEDKIVKGFKEGWVETSSLKSVE